MIQREPRRLAVEHVSEFRYREPVRGRVLVLRLRPRQNENLRLLDFDLEVDPGAAPVPFEDSFGNACHLVTIHREHRSIVVRSSSLVEVLAPSDPTGRARTASWDDLRKAADPVEYWEFLNPSRLVFPCAALDSLTDARGIRPGADPLSSLRETASALHEAFAYEPGTTAVDSSVEHILETGRGVCQDYTHVMLAIARSWGIPSRYVSGYLENEGDGQSVASASHAWAEFLIPGRGWVGVDPTNDSLADHRHVPIAVGRDYFDAAPIRGAIFGGGASSLAVRVSVVESEGPGGGEPVRTERRSLDHATPKPPPQKARSDQ